MLLVCKCHIKEGLHFLQAPHIAAIKEKNFKGICVFCERLAEYKFFYSVPTPKSHRVKVKEMIQKQKENLTR
ncbi:hypothetical protein H1D32_15290 [Anaerobacillus sp. CMMVII]|uniref:hypothetical protein n=1 Tax=Anaerobacillus sp. CMMVII TaxID=2755588 RepID=UPI0021B6F2A1|nr:hypothetical protein [Anaerobacillus sp. CMMVII]MCT8138956.1 hypothetical protein [Anaerobacillus sp. CMMVII]